MLFITSFAITEIRKIITGLKAAAAGTAGVVLLMILMNIPAPTVLARSITPSDTSPDPEWRSTEWHDSLTYHHPHLLQLLDDYLSEMEASPDADPDELIFEYLQGLLHGTTLPDTAFVAGPAATLEHRIRIQSGSPLPIGYRSAQKDTPPHYAGTPLRIIHRHAIHTPVLSAHILQVKLPGEPLSGPAGFDFTSGHLALHNVGPLRRMVAGDYSLRFGQGLMLWSSGSFGKGGPAHRAPLRQPHGLQPYQSAGQTHFFRGIGSEWSLPVLIPRLRKNTGLILTLFYSNRKRSAVPLEGDTIRPPSNNPFHRTENEISRRHNTKEEVSGAHIRLQNRIVQAGIGTYSYRLDRPVHPRPDNPMQGRQNQIIGADFIIRPGNLVLFGEGAARLDNYQPECRHESALDKLLTSCEKTAWSAGFAFPLNRHAEAIWALRSWSPHYWSEYGSAFGEGSGPPRNQHGWYTGIRVRPDPHLMVEAWLDRFRHHGAYQSSGQPAGGYESLVYTRYRMSSGSDWSMRLRYKTRRVVLEEEDAFSRHIQNHDSEYRYALRLQYDWPARSPLTIRTRWDYVHTGYEAASRPGGIAPGSQESGSQEPGSQKSGPQGQTHFGTALSQSLRWNRKQTIRLDLNWMVFHTTDYRARIYLFEHDLSHSLSSIMAYGTGHRSNLVLRMQPAAWIQAEIKLSRVIYHDRYAIGSGHEQTTGPARTYIGFQMIMRH